MKLLFVAISAVLSLSMGGGTYSPFDLTLISSTTQSQSTQQTAEVSPDVNAKIAKLSSPSAVERAQAACQLGELKAASAIPALIRLLGDDAEIRQPVCGERKQWDDSESFKTTPGENAAVALSRMGRQAVEPLIAALSSDVWQARANTAFALGLIHDSRNVEPLIAATKDAMSEVRSKAAWSLGLVGDERAVVPLVDSLKDADEKVRSQAAWALGLKGD